MSIKSLVNMVNTTIPYSWDDSLTVYEFLGGIVSKMNQVIEYVNEEIEEQVRQRIIERLSDFTEERLLELMQSGDLAEMIFSYINDTVDVRLSDIEAALADLSDIPGRVTVLETDSETMAADISDLKNRPAFRNFYNTDGAVTKALNTALSYKGTNSFVYGNGHTLFDADAGPINGKYELDCSSFIQAVLEGITYENSFYLNSRNYKDTTGYFFPPSEFTYSRMLANDLAEHAYKNGYLYYPLPDYSNVHPGDIVFMQNSEAESFFMQIGHVMLVERVDQNGNITIIDANTREDVVAEIRYSLDMLTSRDCTVFARFPLPDVALPAKTINYNAAENTTALKVQTGSVIRTVTTMKDIEPNKMYTMVLKATFTGDPMAYPLINLNGTAYTWAGDVQRRPDGLYHVSFHLPSVPLINKREFTVLAAGTWLEANVTLCALYEGAVSHWNGYIDNIEVSV